MSHDARLEREIRSGTNRPAQAVPSRGITWLIVLPLATACAVLAPATPTPEPSPTVAPSSTPTPTTVPSATPTPSPSPQPELACIADEVVLQLRSVVPYDQFAMHHNHSRGIRSLVIWFVDPALDPLAVGDGLQTNFETALEHAVRLGAVLRGESACVETLFNSFVPVVVDPHYNGWLSGSISPTDLPATSEFGDSELAQAKESFAVNYRQEQPTASHDRPTPPTGACSWPETEQMIRRHFSPERTNVDFYFVLDVGGVNVWAQWDGPLDAAAVAPSLLNVVQELHCLHPVPNRLITFIVDQTGQVGIIGIVEGDVLTSADLTELLGAFRIIGP